MGYSAAFEKEGDSTTARAFTDARDWYDQLVDDARDDSSGWEPRAAREGSELFIRGDAERASPSRSVFDDVDE